MKKALVLIYETFIAILSIIVLKANSLSNKHKIYIFGIPQHGNIGDQAILVGELELIKNELPNYKAIKVSSKYILKFPKLAKKIIKNSIILYTGGGFLGSLWLNEEKMFRKTLEVFDKNRIIAMPQTFYFSDDESGKKTLKDSIEIYEKCNDLIIICREKFSYDFMKKHFKNIKILMLPDMALYLKTINYNTNRSNILLCLRNDKEKTINNSDIIDFASKIQGMSVDRTDTVIKKSFFLKNRSKAVYNKIFEFSGYKLVITDRLHGMVFSYLAKTPCLVVDSKSYKVRGVYDWIKESNYIKFIDSKHKNEQINYLLTVSENDKKEINLKKDFLKIVELIREGDNNG